LHKQYTGIENGQILENAKKISGMKKPMIIRMILIPGINDGKKEIENRLAFIGSLGFIHRLDILKYHRLGEGKYIRLGLKQAMDRIPECTEELAAQVMEKASAMGILTTIGG
jgi:pyruvate formate lyase activating enzyme